uniref:Dihydropyrimidinase like 5b n=1 Tax=Scophthalmus maximus TaxID=52904 RepID=A0A8D3D0A3_SCOMX
MAANMGSMRILIKGGKVVNDDFTHEADVYIENGIIQQVGKELMIPGGAKVIDASGKLVLPGGIDTSVHLQQTFMNASIQDDFYSGTKVRNEMETLVREHGVNSFQMYMAYKDMMMLRDSELYQTLQTCKDIGAIARVHAENGELVAEGAKEALDLGISGPEGIEISRPEELESEATHRAVTIANRARCPIYLVNVSSVAAGDMIAAAKIQGKVVHAETTVAHAVLNGMQYYHQDWAHAAAHVIVPPLRLDPNTPSYLMGLLANDSLSVVASEHRPFSTKQRALGKEDFTKIPHGVAGVQDRMSVIWERGVVTGKMDENRFVAVTSSNAAKIYNLYPRKGRIIVGADADVVVWDPDAARTISVSTQVQGGDFNLYEGMRCHGVPLVTISRGRLVCENGVFMCAEGSGKFYAQRTFPDYLYKKMVQREKVCFGFSSSTSVFLDLRTFCYCMCSDDESVHLKVNRFPLGTRARSVLHQLTANAPIKLCLH